MRVLLATDGSGTAIAATKTVEQLAEHNPIDVTVVTVSYDPQRYQFQPWVPEWTEQENARTAKILADAKRTLDRTCQSVSIKHVSGAVVPAILDEATKSRADLIVIGAKGHSAIGRLLLGSVSDSVASKADCSVLVVRPNDTLGFDRVVVGYDKSVASREAVAELMEMKLSDEMHFDVVSVAEQPYVYVGEGFAEPPIALSPAQIRPIEETCERMASQIAEHFHRTRSHTPIAAHVGDAIVQQAESAGADLILVGDTGHGMLDELFLGSTSKYVLRHAPCSVWISRHHTKTTGDAKEESGHAVAAN
ncbi:Universal stress protein [Stieleria bergensis]|uniref:Universal stress protein n=1 Tax=Stieleria bergensis TaxID=2528025 RepID=A0A517SZE9_9BACT|nr:Universal stress protein [Planctomycetes bacterium SV_7m_r]